MADQATETAGNSGREASELTALLSCPSCGYDYSDPDNTVGIDDVFAYATISSGTVLGRCYKCNKELEFHRTITDTIRAR